MQTTKICQIDLGAGVLNDKLMFGQTLLAVKNDSIDRSACRQKMCVTLTQLISYVGSLHMRLYDIVPIIINCTCQKKKLSFSFQQFAFV